MFIMHQFEEIFSYHEVFSLLILVGSILKIRLSMIHDLLLLILRILLRGIIRLRIIGIISELWTGLKLSWVILLCIASSITIFGHLLFIILVLINQRLVSEWDFILFLGLVIHVMVVFLNMEVFADVIFLTPISNLPVAITDLHEGVIHLLAGK